MPGSARLRDCDMLRRITCKQAEENRLYGVINAAPAVTLLPWGLLKRRKITCHPAFFHKLPTFWAVKMNIQVSKGLTTSRGPGTAYMFALTLAEQLFGEFVARALPSSLSFKLKLLEAPKLVVDASISDCSDQIFNLIALPGGMPGSARLRDCDVLRRITCKQAEENRLYGAINAAPAITLLPWGLLKRRKITCHPAFFHKLPTFWAVKTNIQVSKGLTTSRGPGTAYMFALTLAEQLFGEFVARAVTSLIFYWATGDTCMVDTLRQSSLISGSWHYSLTVPILDGEVSSVNC
ncbi:hypothetical protein RYX36_028367 [Vicia faba]